MWCAQRCASGSRKAPCRMDTWYRGQYKQSLNHARQRMAGLHLEGGSEGCGGQLAALVGHEVGALREGQSLQVHILSPSSCASPHLSNSCSDC